MAGNRPTPQTGRKAVRYAVPVAVAGVAAATIGIGSALAQSGDPDLPKIGAQELIAKVAGSDAQRLSGSVRITTDLGLPELPGGMSGMSFGGPAEGKGGGHGEQRDAPSPQAKLTELAAGTHTLRVAADGPDKQRLSIVESAAEYSVVRNGDQVWAYDSGSNTAYHSTAPRHDTKDGGEPKGVAAASPQELAKKLLAAVDDTTSVTVDGTAKVAGRDAYQLLIKPKQGESTVGSVRIAVDAKNGVPLKFTLTPKGGGKAAVDAAFTKVDFGAPSAGTFSFTPPKGTKVTEAPEHKDGGRGDHKAQGPSGMSGLDVVGKGWTSIAEFSSGDAKGGPVTGKGKSGKDSGKDAGANLLDSFGTKVSGSFGTGRVVSTRIVNALITDDGKVYAGAVTKEALIKAAEAAK
ncbi:DUF2092 domain-containing protein [Streptomyces sp. NPDC049577]|uniref:LolA family protein n=1 Tax=Streptomyces sp. NPDC049577 TaxID=3155153 RepID=UPI0034255293